jgi:peptidoglycan-associated lipoprotein
MRDRALFRVAPALVLLAACGGRQPEPVATAPQPADTTPRVAAAAPAPAARDTTPRVDPARARADSVRAQILRDTVAAAPAVATPSGLPPADDSVLTALIHFGFDSAELTDSARAVLTEKVQLLRRNDRLRIQIAGHADERGSDEYNLALGLRRAAAAKQFLTAYGIDGDRISIVSFGEERPLDSASSEEAWARNRRGEFQPRRP